MRITENMITSKVLSNLQLAVGRMEKIQMQASTGLKVSRPGEDPVSAQQILQLKGLLKDADQYGRNITVGNSWLEQSDSAMNDMGNIVTRAREIAVQMANGTYSAQDRISAASEVAQLKKELIQLGNSQIGGNYIFGGYVSDRAPFDAATGAYNGTNDPINMEIDRGSYVAINVAGGQLLRGGTPPGSSGIDLIGTIDALHTALSANDPAGVQGTLSGLTSAQNQILAMRGDVGARLNRVQTATENNDAIKVSLSKVVSAKQDADILQVMSDLTLQQTAFQAALSSTAKTSQMSLLDYLR